MSAEGVTVIIVTYNHERFIAEALDSVLAQETEFPVEIVISDDASTDSTCEIVRRYIAAQPQQIRLLCSDRNLNTNEVTTRAVASAGGMYLAIMDGDDFWTSPHKLTRQAAFLESHPGCAVCFHDVTVVDSSGAVLEPRFVPPGFARFTGLDDIMSGNYVPGCAAMFRATALRPMPQWVRDAPYGDWALLIVAARHGLLGFVDEVLAAYRRHPAGVWSGLGELGQLIGIVRFFEFLEGVVWPERTEFVRQTRAAWRVKLMNRLDACNDDELLAAQLDEGSRLGDICLWRCDHDPLTGGNSNQGRRLAAGLQLQIDGDRELEPVQPGDTLNGHLDSVSFPAGGKRLLAYGWGPFGLDDAEPSLIVQSSDPVREAAVVRLGRADVAAIVRSDLVRSGFWLRLVAENVFTCHVRLLARARDGTIRLIGEAAPASEAR